MANRRSGFTLIELLIVIGILGILATGLLAAVDPFEQLKKARDTNKRNAVVELHNGFIRYYATHGDLPWDDTGADAACQENFTTARVVSDTAADACVDELISDGELKEDFVSALGGDADDIYISSADAVSVAVCFSPTSKAIFNDSATKYDNLGQTGVASCSASAKESVTPGTTCFWCAK